MGEIISRFSIKSLKNSVSLPTHDPISFGFEKIIRAKAENAAVKQELADIGKVCKGRANNDLSEANVTDTPRSEYIYDYNAVAELSEIKRRKNRG